MATRSRDYRQRSSLPSRGNEFWPAWDRVIARIHTINPAARITLLGLYDPYHFTHLGPFLDEQVDLWDARLISRFAADRHVTVLRIADLLLRPDRLSPIDHFHPGSMGYALVAARIAPAL